MEVSLTEKSIRQRYTAAVPFDFQLPSPQVENQRFAFLLFIFPRYLQLLWIFDFLFRAVERRYTSFIPIDALRIYRCTR